MIFRKKKHLVGLDIGSRTIKACELVQSQNGFSLKNLALMDIEPGLIVDGMISRSSELAGAVRTLFSKHKIKERNIALAIGGYSVIMKNITVKKTDEKAMHSFVTMEAEQYIPFDINDVNIDFHVLGQNKHNADQLDILLVAAKKEIVEDYAGIVEAAGFSPAIIDIDALALQNCYEFNQGSENNTSALIDIGASKTSLNIIKNSVPVFMRDVSLGCGQIDQQIASHCGCSVADAQKIKAGEHSDKITEDEIASIETDVIKNWCAEIRRAIDFFYSTYPEESFGQIILSGGGANMEEFRELLALETSTHVEVINPFTNIQINRGQFDTAYIEKIAPQAAVCVGLALRSVDDK
ncbi:MAG: pilus assembly protein PilM [Deltaproteobacteria bacterium]|nr:MAG: pilus assembly protein PilM [Deltaproteobacteria bacterium]